MDPYTLIPACGISADPCQDFGPSLCRLLLQWYLFKVRKGRNWDHSLNRGGTIIKRGNQSASLSLPSEIHKEADSSISFPHIEIPWVAVAKPPSTTSPGLTVNFLTTTSTVLGRSGCQEATCEICHYPEAPRTWCWATRNHVFCV